MTENQSIQQIIQSLPPDYVVTITDETDIGVLYEKLSKTNDLNKRVVINARLENLQYLVSSI